MPSQATLTTVNALTKEIYTGQIRDQFYNEVIGLKRIQRSSDGVTSEVGGKYVTFPVRVSRNAGIGYRQEDETLQDPGAQGYKRVNIGLKYGYGRVKLTGPVMDLAESNVQSFASTLQQEMTGLKNDLARDASRIFYGDGSGKWAQITNTPTAGASVTYNVDDAYNFAGQIGAIVDIVLPASNTPSAGANGPAYVDPNGTDPALLSAPLYNAVTAVNTVPLQVTAVNLSANTVTLAGVGGNAPAGAANQIITRRGNYGREPYGLAALVNTQVLFGLNDPIWQSTINANGGTPRALSEGLMIKMTDDLRVNGGKTSLILTSLGVRRAYFALLSQQRRYTETKQFDGGIQGLAFHNGREIPVVDDPDAPKGKLWFLDEAAFTVRQDKDWSWLDTDGGIWKWVQNKDAFEAVMKKYWQIGVTRRNSNGLLSDITEG